MLLKDLLKGVSRAFHLTLSILPRSVRGPISLAYLLARAADTIADTRLIPPDERLKHLLSFRAQLEGPTDVQALHEIERSLTGEQFIPDERALLTSLTQIFSLLEALPGVDRDQVCSIVVTLTRGMEIDLTSFPSEDSGQVAAFKDWGELDRYIHYVAGCVGGFWTEMTIAHVPSLRTWDSKRMSETGVRFGKALQLTNVLRDIPKDVRIGRCYLPKGDLSELGVAPEDLLSASTGAQARPALVKGIEVALGHYSCAEEYLFSIPRRSLRLRLAALWPILIGLATLTRLARNRDWLAPENPSRVSRRWVYRMLVASLPCAYSNRALGAWIARLRRQVQSSL